MNIRKATIHDEYKILKIHKEAIEAGCKNHYSEKQISSWATPQELSPYEERLKNSLFLIAEEGGKCIGFGSISRERPEIEALFVSPEYFGKGVGSEMLSQLEKVVNFQSNGQFQVDSTRNAVPFYEKHGYHQHSECAHTEPDGTEVECIRMVKKMASGL